MTLMLRIKLDKKGRGVKSMKKTVLFLGTIVMLAFLGSANAQYYNQWNSNTQFLGNNLATGLGYGWANDLDKLRQTGVPGVRSYPFTMDAPMGLTGAWLDPRPRSNGPRYYPTPAPRGGPQFWPTPPPPSRGGGGGGGYHHRGR